MKELGVFVSVVLVLWLGGAFVAWAVIRVGAAADKPSKKQECAQWRVK